MISKKKKYPEGGVSSVLSSAAVVEATLAVLLAATVATACWLACVVMGAGATSIV